MKTLLNKYISIFLVMLLISCTSNSEEEGIIINEYNNNRIIFLDDMDNLYESVKHNFYSEEATRLYVKATFKFQANETDLALKLMRQANKIEPNNRLILKDFGIMFEHVNKLDSAHYYYKKCMQVDSTYSQCLIVYGLSVYSIGADRLAINYYNKAIKYLDESSDPRLFSMAYYNKAIAYEQLGIKDSCCINLLLSNKYTEPENNKHIIAKIKDIGCQ